ncbi:DMT family transporter [Ramlibacter pallidus]|uniref:DMT family transporter n=1 Tax=Ramlibacter pallidus TaxID=2780087 RepID=A0ABR9RYJ6_9BURK|nr:DMT family transporter [Ramlibacter pallidus]MBE7365959.1 DMT family transporter [Ramlibacter pallidus]
MPFASIVDFIALAAIWGASFMFMRFAVGDFGVLGTAAARVAVASAFLLPLMLVKGHAATFRREWWKVMGVGLLNSALPFLLFAFAVVSITTGLASILNATAPLFGALVAWIWLKDRPTGSRVLGLFVGFAGVAMLAWDKATFRPDASGVAPAWAILACLLACVCYGLAASATKRYLTGLPPLVTASGSQAGATVGLGLLMPWFLPQQMPGTQAWAAAIVLGVLCTGVAYILYFRLIENAGPARALAVTFVIPVFAVLYGVLFLGERVTAWMVLCGAVIVLGTALSTGLLKLPARRAPA